MPELKCTVQTCLHNKSFYCELDAIKVEGDSAKKAVETCCGSFEERKEGQYSNSASASYSNSDVTGTASDTCGIDCKATDCLYNEACKCHAGKISIEGSNACQCQETECASFKCS